MASKIKADQLETVDGTGSITLNNDIAMASGKTLPAASLTGSLPSGMGGKILQVKHTYWKPSSSLTITNQIWLTDLDVTITPTSSSSKLISFISFGMLHQAGSDNYIEIRYYRDSTAIDGGGYGLGYSEYHGTYMVDNYKPHTYIFPHQETTGSTSSRTYKLRMNTDSNWVVHRDAVNSHIIMEYEV